MISRKYRFHGRASIQRLYKNGNMVRSGSLSLRYAPNPRRNEYRLAVVVSRKVNKSAVVRNRIRRRIYEHVRILSKTFTSPNDLAIVVYEDTIATAPADEVSREVEKLLKKAKLTTPGTSGRAIVEPKK
jgi:ribonuclease P protein component